MADAFDVAMTGKDQLTSAMRGMERIVGELGNMRDEAALAAAALERLGDALHSLSRYDDAAWNVGGRELGVGAPGGSAEAGGGVVIEQLTVYANGTDDVGDAVYRDLAAKLKLLRA